jgi:hypothetical protein
MICERSKKLVRKGDTSEKLYQDAENRRMKSLNRTYDEEILTKKPLPTSEDLVFKKL